MRKDFVCYWMHQNCFHISVCVCIFSPYPPYPETEFLFFLVGNMADQTHVPGAIPPFSVCSSSHSRNLTPDLLITYSYLSMSNPHPQRALSRSGSLDKARKVVDTLYERIYIENLLIRMEHYRQFNERRKAIELKLESETDLETEKQQLYQSVQYWEGKKNDKIAIHQ